MKFCLLTITCKRCGKQRDNATMFKHNGGPRSGVSRSRVCLVCQGYAASSGAVSFDDYERWKTQQLEAPKSYCLIRVFCSHCGRRRDHGSMFRHEGGARSGLVLGKKCLICQGYDRHVKLYDTYSYDEYESIYLRSRTDARLAKDGLAQCRKCSVLYPLSRKIKKLHWCPDCRRDYRSEKARSEKFARWGVEDESGLSAAQLSRWVVRLQGRFHGRWGVGAWHRWSWDYWCAAAGKSVVSRVCFRAGVVWKNPFLTRTERWRLRYRFDLKFQVQQRLRRQMKKKERRDAVGDLIRRAVNQDGRSSAVESKLGYSVDEFIVHFESLFSPGMDWDAFKSGAIHIDHVKPQRLFNLSDDDQWRECWALENLQPLWAEDNLRKSGKYEEFS